MRTDDLYCQRVYRFSVEVWPAPSGSVFRHTKVRSGCNIGWCEMSPDQGEVGMQ